jgi:hypothetical protein
MPRTTAASEASRTADVTRSTTRGSASTGNEPTAPSTAVPTGRLLCGSRRSAPTIPRTAAIAQAPESQPADDGAAATKAINRGSVATAMRAACIAVQSLPN